MQNNTFSALFVGQNLVKLSKVDSTNNYLKNLLSNYEPLAEGTVIMADHQFAGRGQRGNTWEAKKGENLTVSIYLKPSFLKVTEQFELSKAVSLGIIDYLTILLGEDCKIKWPNDIYVGNNKIGGLLIENTLAGGTLKSSIVGIGLNINQTEFEGLDKAASLKKLFRQDFDINQILKGICFYIEGRYNSLKANDTKKLHANYLSSLYRMNEMADFMVSGNKISGKIVNVSKSGELVIDKEGAVSHFNFKEITFII